LKQRIRFCTAVDGVQVAFAEHGEGPPLLKAANWLTHLEFDWKSPVWRHWLEDLGRGHLMVRYDERGCGLSDRQFERDAVDAHLDDLEAVADAASSALRANRYLAGWCVSTVKAERVTHLVSAGRTREAG
jgi:pimeloyl-ACP methyl ester carboxylesterase